MVDCVKSNLFSYGEEYSQLALAIFLRGELMVMRGLSPKIVPNFTTFYHTVLGAAIDPNGRRRRYVINLRRRHNRSGHQ